MDNTLSKQGYFIIALTLSKRREHIQIPCNSNHLLAEPCILSWGGLVSLRDCCVPDLPRSPGLSISLWSWCSAQESLGREPCWEGGLDAALSWAWAVSVCWDSCHLSGHSHWLLQRFGVPRITTNLFGFLLYMGRSRAWQETVWLREKSEGLWTQENYICISLLLTSTLLALSQSWNVSEHQLPCL